jgi:hypothetical protein
MLVPGMAAMSVTGTLPPMPGPEEPGPFSLADPDRVRSILGAAGFEHVDVTPHADHVVGSEAEIPRIVALATAAGPAREAMREADEDTRRRVVEAVDTALRERVREGELRMTRSIHLVRATARA